MSPAAGYSGTPLAKKLGITDGTVVCRRHAPPEYRTRLEPPPAGVSFATRVTKATAVVHVFATEARVLATELAALRLQVAAAAAVWVSWPQKGLEGNTPLSKGGDVKESGTVPRPAVVESSSHLPPVDLLIDARSELFELAVRSGLKCWKRCWKKIGSRSGTVRSEVVLGGRKVGRVPAARAGRRPGGRPPLGARCSPANLGWQCFQHHDLRRLDSKVR